MKFNVPARYADYFKRVQVDDPEYPGVVISVPPFIRGALCWRWECRRCGQFLKPNNAAAQSHLAKHVREKLKAEASRGL